MPGQGFEQVIHLLQLISAATDAHNSTIPCMGIAWATVHSELTQGRPQQQLGVLRPSGSRHIVDVQGSSRAAPISASRSSSVMLS